MCETERAELHKTFFKIPTTSAPHVPAGYF
jgi:hypothetical protein